MTENQLKVGIDVLLKKSGDRYVVLGFLPVKVGNAEWTPAVRYARRSDKREFARDIPGFLERFEVA